MTQTVSDVFTPLVSAVYDAGTNKILGTMNNYIVRFNATTGAYEAAVKASAPMYGPTKIGLLGTDVYLSAYNDRAVQETLPVPDANRVRCDIFPVNTTTLLLGTGLQIPQHVTYPARNQSINGPQVFLKIGTRCYYTFPLHDYVLLAWIDMGNPLLSNSQKASWNYWTDQIATSGGNIYYCDPSWPEIAYRDSNLNYIDWSSTPGYYPISCEYAVNVGLIFALCGNKTLIRVNAWGAALNTYFDLEAALALEGFAITGIKPYRLRYSSIDGKLYIPVQNKDGVIVYDPNGVAPIQWKSGFSSPMDVVFTATKAFAVQTSETGLKEIT